MDKKETVKSYIYTATQFKDGAESPESKPVQSGRAFQSLEEAVADFLKTQGCPEGEAAVLLSSEDGNGYLAFKKDGGEVVGVFTEVTTEVTYSSSAKTVGLDAVKKAAEALSETEERA